MSITVGTLVVEMSANVARLQQDMDRAVTTVKGAATQIAQSWEKVTTVFETVLGGASLAEVLTESVKAASQSEQAFNRLGAVIRATGDASGYTREQLDEVAKSLASTTTFNDTDIVNAQANLMKFGRLHGDTFKRALQDTADYAQYSGKSMTEASQLIGRAVADPVNGLKALGAEFGKLSQTQKDTIEKFMDLGRTTDAADVILKKIEGQIGGTAIAMNTGLLGATKAVSNAWDGLLVTLGKTPPVQIATTTALHLIADGLHFITEELDKQTRAIDKNPLYNGGKLQPLPPITGDPLKALQGSGLTINDARNLPPGLRPSILPDDLNGMTIEQGLARRRADEARRKEEAQARAEYQKKLMESARPLADEISNAYAKAEIAQKAAGEETLYGFYHVDPAEIEKLAEDIGKTYTEATLRQAQAGSETLFAFRLEENRRLGILDEQEKRDRLVQILDGMRSEREIEDHDYLERYALLQERYLEDYNLRSLWQAKILQLDREHNKRLIELDKSFQGGANQGLLEVFQTASDSAAQARSLVVDSFKSMEDALVGFVKTGKLDFKSLADTIVTQMIRIRIEQSVTAPLSAALGSSNLFQSALNLFSGTGNTSGGSTAATFNSAMYIGAKAGGGDVSADQPYLVGERGPELFVPSSAGSIVPNGQLGGKTVGIHIENLDMRGASEDAVIRLEKFVRLMNGSIESRAVNAVAQARQRGQAGLR